MSRLMITSDLHLGHDNAIKWRQQFSTPEEHHETLFDNLASNIGKRDTLIMLGDMAFNSHWLHRIAGIKCQKKILVLGNHDTERVHIRDIVLSGAYDDMHSLYYKRNKIFSHCPIHPKHMRGKDCNIHGHLHEEIITEIGPGFSTQPHHKYFNACVEHTDYKPIPFAEILERINA